MEQSHWEANNQSVSQEIPTLYGTRTVCRVYKNPSLAPVLNQTHGVILTKFDKFKKWVLVKNDVAFTLTFTVLY